MAKKTLTCRQPDRHVSKLLCGYPLPCPWHTVVLDMKKDPPVMEVPVTADAAIIKLERLAEIAEALKD